MPQQRLPPQLRGLAQQEQMRARSAELAVVEGVVKTITMENKTTGYLVAKIKVPPRLSLQKRTWFPATAALAWTESNLFGCPGCSRRGFPGQDAEERHYHCGGQSQADDAGAEGPLGGHLGQAQEVWPAAAGGAFMP